VVGLARRKDRLEGVMEECRRLGVRAEAVVGDITRAADIRKAVELAVREFGGLDVVVANAGFAVIGRLDRLSLDDYRRQFEVNVFGALATVQGALAELRRSRGAVILMGSVSGHVAMPSSSAYSMSKFAVRSLAEALGPELREDGVSVTLVTPGYVASEIRRVDRQGVFHPELAEPLSRAMLMPADVAARKIVCAAHRRRSEIRITWIAHAAILLQNFLPGLARWIKSAKARVKADEPGPGA